MKYDYTLNNHLEYSIGGRAFGRREDSIEPFKVKLGAIDPVRYQNSSYRTELLRTADTIYKQFGKDLVLMLSGGTDSEIVVRNFIELGIRPRCAAIRFIGGYNEADINEALAIANELDIDLEILDFDIKDFYNSGEAKEFGEKLQCTQVTYLMVYRNILKLGCPAVMGGEVLLTRNIPITGDSYWYYTFRENEDASAMRFSEVYDIPLVNEYFSYTPELLLHYLEDKDIQSLITTKNNFKLSSVSSKNAILKRLYPEIRNKIKTHGFERLLGFNYESYRAISADQVKRLEPSLDGIRMDDAIRMLRNES